jgi:carboxypeptidase D
VIPEHNGNLFFWRFENKHLANRHRTVLWLNGGPGCSSEDGVMMEIGPYRLKGEKLEEREGAWDEFSNLLFVDNPVGTGYSYVDTNSYIHELHTMAENMVVFLEKYYKIFPEEEGNDLYIAGESYAGQHIPYIAKAILDRNKSGNTAKKWNLQGLLIGNGWISAKEQGPAYLAYAYKEGLVQKGSKIGNELDHLDKACQGDMAKDGDNVKIQYRTCEAVLSAFLEKTVDKNGRCINMYDTRKDDTYPSCGMNWPPDLKDVTPYLRKPEVVKALNIDSKKMAGWSECNGGVGGAFKPTDAPSIKLMPDILAEIPVLLFSGQKDLICNHLGTEELIKNMEWNGGKGFEISPGTWAPRRDWTFEDDAAGFYQEARNLTYVLFYNSSHMVPFDFPRRSRDMLDRFMKVDIGTIGGTPANSKIDGEKGLETSVGGHPNSTAAEEQKQEQLEEARWAAYYRSGAVALVVVAILAVCFGWYVWQDRRRRAGYKGIEEDMSRPSFMRRDVEATDFDEDELDDLHSPQPGENRYSLGAMSSDDEVDGHEKKATKGGANGQTNGQ